MRSLRQRLQAYAQEHGPIRVGLVGAGQMGTGLMSQMERMDGMRAVAVADVVPNRAQAAFGEASVPADLVVCVEESDSDPVGKANEVIAAGKRVATHSADLLVQIDNLDVIVESTGVPEVGAFVCEAAIRAGKHVVNMNVEADATIGYLLAQMAEEAGVVYSLAAGDEPGSIKETEVNEPLINWHSFDGDHGLRALYETNGWARDVSDRNMLRLAKALREKEGLNVLPAATAGLAALAQPPTAELLQNDRFVVILTSRK